MSTQRVRHEIHYGQRIVRCFADRPNDVYTLLRDAAARWPDRTAVVLGDQRVGYRDLDDAVGRIAANLIAAGLKPGDRVVRVGSQPVDDRLDFALALLEVQPGEALALIAKRYDIIGQVPEIDFLKVPEQSFDFFGFDEADNPSSLIA